MRGVSIIEAMVIDMNEAQVRTLKQVRQVVAGTQALEFRSADDDEGRYAWIEQVLQLALESMPPALPEDEPVPPKAEAPKTEVAAGGAADALPH